GARRRDLDDGPLTETSADAEEPGTAWSRALAPSGETTVLGVRSVATGAAEAWPPAEGTVGDGTVHHVGDVLGGVGETGGRLIRGDPAVGDGLIEVSRGCIEEHAATFI